MKPEFIHKIGLGLALCAMMAVPALASDFIQKQEFGQVQPRGVAQVSNPINGPLLISNIGSSGLDGVRISTGSGGSIGPVRWMAPEMLSGRGLNVVVDAEDPAGIPCAFASAFTYDTPGRVIATFDPMTSGVTDLVVRVYRNGNPLFESNAQVGTSPLYASSAPPFGFGTTGPYLPLPPYDDSIFGWLFPGGTTVTLPGQTPVICDMVTFEFDPAAPVMTLLGCEILGVEPAGSTGELMITDFPSTLFHHRIGRIGAATPLMVDNLGSSGEDSGVRVSNIGSSGLDGVCVALNPDDTGLGVHLEPMDATSGDVLRISGLSLSPQPTDRVPLPTATSGYIDSFFDVWTDLSVNDPPSAIRCLNGDELVEEILDPKAGVRLRDSAAMGSVQHPYRLEMARDDGDKITYTFYWHLPLRYTDTNGIDNDCDIVELDFDPPIGGPWYDWDAIELAALLILLGDIDINGTPNSSGGYDQDPIILEMATGLGASDISTDSAGHLKVDNLGSSGCDGVSLAAPGGGTGSGMGVTWNAMAHRHPHRGHVTVLKAHGGYGGGGGGGGQISVRAADADTNGGEWGLSADFSDLGPAGVIYNILNEGSQVASIICAGTMEECLQLSEGPISCEVVLNHPDGRPRLRVGLPPQTDYVDMSSPLKMMGKADMIEFVYDGTPVTPFVEITALDIMMGNMEGALVVTSAGETSGYASAQEPTPFAGVFELGAPSPNPFNPLTSVAFELKRGADISLQVYDLRGQRVRELVKGFRPSGRFSARWDGLDESGRAVSSGTYVFRLSGAGEAQTRKAVLVR